MPELLLLVLRSFVAAIRSRRDLTLENLVLRHQLQVALRTNPHPRLRAPDRVLWVGLRRLWPEGWRQHLRVVQPETVLRWHRKGWRLYWTWKSRTRARSAPPQHRTEGAHRTNLTRESTLGHRAHSRGAAEAGRPAPRRRSGYLNFGWSFAAPQR